MAGVGLWRNGKLFPIHVDLYVVERNKCRPYFLRASTYGLATVADMAVAFAHRKNLLWPLCVSSAADAHLTFGLAGGIPLSAGVDAIRDLFSRSAWPFDVVLSFF